MSGAAGKVRLNIVSIRPGLVNVLLVLLACAPFRPVPGQTLDAGIDALLEDEIDSQVEAEVESQIEAEVESQIEAEVESQIEAEVEAAVEASIEQQVEAEVAGAVEQQVEAEVAASVEAQIEADVAAAVEDQIEAGVEAAVEQQVEAGIEASVEQAVAAGVASSIEQQVEASVSQSVEAAVESRVAESVELSVEAQLDASIEASLDTDLDVGDDLREALEQGVGALNGEDGEETGSGEAFAADVDAAGRAVEAQVWVVLVPFEYSERIDEWGFTVRERRELAGFDRVLLRVDAPEDRDIAEAALELALDAPGTVVDYNHLYVTSQDGFASAPSRSGPSALSVGGPKARLAVGMVDSMVDVEHPALEGIEIEQQDFVPFDNERVNAHGTAIASIIAGSADRRAHGPRFDKLWAASVFFKDESGSIRATTAGLLAAVDWLAQQAAVDVINMSLAGPPNRLLEVVLDEARGKGVLVVAAVGNNGPVGEPLYPAAYESVVGVTAVDDEHRIYRYANRGRQVMFAAPGVQIEVAAPAGGSSMQSGTSLAAPYVAALLAELIAERGWAAEAALEHLKHEAIDLGERYYDEIFGFGLVAGRD